MEDSNEFENNNNQISKDSQNDNKLNNEYSSKDNADLCAGFVDSLFEVKRRLSELVAEKEKEQEQVQEEAQDQQENEIDYKSEPLNKEEEALCEGFVDSLFKVQKRLSELITASDNENNNALETPNKNGDKNSEVNPKDDDIDNMNAPLLRSGFKKLEPLSTKIEPCQLPLQIPPIQSDIDNNLIRQETISQECGDSRGELETLESKIMLRKGPPIIQVNPDSIDNVNYNVGPKDPDNQNKSAEQNNNENNINNINNENKPRTSVNNNIVIEENPNVQSTNNINSINNITAKNDKSFKNRNQNQQDLPEDETMTINQAKFLLSHRKDILTIQKMWKGYFDRKRIQLLRQKIYIIQAFYRRHLIKKYNLPQNFYNCDKFLKNHTEIYEENYKNNLRVLFPALFMDKTDLNVFASNMLEMANNPCHSPYETGKIHLFAKILDFDMMIDTDECYETLWALIFDSIYSKCLRNNDPIQIISLGGQHTMCVTNKGKIYSFGWNNYGQCGVPKNSTVIAKKDLVNNRLIGKNPLNELILRVINRVDGVKIPEIDQVLLCNSVTCGEDHSLVVDKNGKMWSFGLNLNGQLGLDHNELNDKPSDCSPINKNKINSVKSASYVNFATSVKGEIFIWPWNDKNGNIHYSPNRFFLKSPQEKVVSVECGNNFCLILNSNGLVYSMGKSNKYGQLGLGDYANRYHPTLIEFFAINQEKITQISCGFKHCVAKTSTGRCYTWGCGCKGQLGQGNYNNMTIPGLVNFDEQFTKIIQVSAGFRSTFFLKENRKVYSCGSNGTIAMENSPILYDIIDKIPEMSIEQNYSIVRIMNTWCKSFSIFYATIADSTTMKISPVRINNILNNLASKWVDDKINPPYIESIANFFQINSMKKPNNYNKKEESKI